MPTLVVGRMFLFEHYIEEKINQSLADSEVKQLFHLMLIDLLDKNGEIVRLKNVLLMVTQRMMTLEQKLDDNMSSSLQCKPPNVVSSSASLSFLSKFLYLNLKINLKSNKNICQQIQTIAK